MPPPAQKPSAPDFIPADSAPDFIPASGKQGPVRRFLTRAMDLPEGVFDRPGDYLNPFSKGYWDDARHPVDRGGPPTSVEYPGKQTISDAKAGNYAGAAGDVLPAALAAAQMARPAMGRLGQAMEANAPRVANFAAHPVSSVVRPVVRGGVRVGGRMLQRMAGTGDAPPAAENRVMTPTGSAPAPTAESTQAFSPKPLAEQPQAQPAARPQGGYGLTAQSTEEMLEPATNTTQYGLTPRSFEEFQRLLAEPPEPAPNAGTVVAGKGPNWEDIANAGVGRQVSLARQMDLAGEGLPTPTTGEGQSLTDAMANFGVPDQTPVDMNQYYGKTRQTGMPTPHELLKPHQRQLRSSTFSTAPVPGPHPPEIMRILNTPGDIPEPDWSMLQNYFARQRGAVSSGR